MLLLSFDTMQAHLDSTQVDFLQGGLQAHPITQITTILLVNPSSVLWPVQVQTIIHKATNLNLIYKETYHYVSTDDPRPYPKYHIK